MAFKTDQEEFWAGSFGDFYIDRNKGSNLLASNLKMWASMLAKASGIDSCIEFGANIGMNLMALQLLYPGQEQFGVEINEEAATRLGDVIPKENVFNSSVLEFHSERKFDLSFTKGVLIHISPSELSGVYDKLVASSNRYILIAEYYSPTPVAIPYRGHADRLFKRDFAGEIMDRHPEVSLLDYGFVYRGDTSFPQDDITWFLMKKGK